MKKFFSISLFAFTFLVFPSNLNANASDDAFLENYYEETAALVAKVDQQRSFKNASGDLITLDAINSQSFYEGIVKEVISLRAKEPTEKPPFESLDDVLLLVRIDKTLKIIEQLAFYKIYLQIIDAVNSPHDKYTYEAIYAPASDNVQSYKLYLRDTFKDVSSFYHNKKNL